MEENCTDILDVKEKHLRILDAHIVEIRRVLDPDQVLPYFIEVNEMTDEDIAKIRVITTGRHDKVDVFMDVLKRSKHCAFDVFVKALLKVHEHLACLLLRSELDRVKGDLTKTAIDLRGSRGVVKRLQTNLKKEQINHTTTKTERDKFKSQFQPGDRNENQATSSRPQNLEKAKKEVEHEAGGEESKTTSLAEMNDIIKRLEGLLNKACTELSNTSGQIGENTRQLEVTLSRLSKTTESFQVRVSSSRGPRHRVTEEDRSHQQNRAEEQEAEPLGTMSYKNEIQRKCEELRQSNNKSNHHVNEINNVKHNLLREIKEAGERLSQDEANELTAQLQEIITIREKIDELEKAIEVYKSEKVNSQAENKAMNDKTERRLDKMKEDLAAQEKRVEILMKERDENKNKVDLMEEKCVPRMELDKIKGQLGAFHAQMRVKVGELRREKEEHAETRKELESLRSQSQPDRRKGNKKQKQSAKRNNKK